MDKKRNDKNKSFILGLNVFDKIKDSCGISKSLSTSCEDISIYIIDIIIT